MVPTVNTWIRLMAAHRFGTAALNSIRPNGLKSRVRVKTYKYIFKAENQHPFPFTQGGYTF